MLKIQDKNGKIIAILKDQDTEPQDLKKSKEYGDKQ